jgi:hypothetical protein
MKSGPLDAVALQKGCFRNHNKMHKRMLRCAKRATADAGTTHLFVMSHPDIRPRIQSLFAEVRVPPQLDSVLRPALRNFCSLCMC